MFGTSFWGGGVAAPLGSSEGAARLADWLTELVERELIMRRPQSKFAGEMEYQFRHDLVREAAHAMLTEGDRKLGHRLAATWLERAGKAEAMVLAGHFERGGEPLRAIEHYRRAAQQSLEGNDLPAAVERAEWAVACGAQGESLGEMRMLQAEAECWRGRFAEAERYGLEAMERLPHGGPQWAGAGNFLQWAAGAREHAAVLHGVAQAFLDLPDEHRPHDEEIITMAWLATTYLFCGDAEMASRLFAKAEARARARASVDALAEAQLLDARAAWLLFAGDVPVAIDQFEAAIAMYARIGDLRHAALARMNLAVCLIQLGDYRRGNEVLRENLLVAERMGLTQVAASSRQNLAIALFSVRELEEARAMAEASIAESRAFGEVRMEERI